MQPDTAAPHRLPPELSEDHQRSGAMTKRRPPIEPLDPQEPTTKDGIEYVSVGSGDFEDVKYKIPAEVQGLFLDPWKPRSAEEQQQMFGLHFGHLSEQAVQILEAADPPINMKPLRECYTIFGGTGYTASKEGVRVPEDFILKIVGLKGYLRPDREWYAARVLASLETIWRGIAEANSRGETAPPVAVAILAWKLGRLVREMEIRVGKIGERNRAAGEVRGKQQKAARSAEHAAIREAAAKMKPTLTKRAKARLLKKKFPKLSVETIRKRS